MAERALLTAWSERARVRLAVWVHPACDRRLRDGVFAADVAHALTAPLQSALHVTFSHGPWSAFLKALDVYEIPLDDVRALLHDAPSGDAFYICPQSVNARLRPERAFTHTLGVVPRAWLHARVELTRRGRLSVTDMIARAALLDERRFIGADAPARAYDRLLLPSTDSEAARAETLVGFYQRYVISHEFGHLLGLGHPQRDWRAAQSAILTSLARARARASADDGDEVDHFVGARFHPCMDQQTVNAAPDLIPLPVPSLLDILLQEPRAIGMALAQADALFPARARAPNSRA